MPDLEGIYFGLNPHDLYVANMNVNVMEMTMVFYVNDIKILHLDLCKVDSIIK